MHEPNDNPGHAFRFCQLSVLWPFCPACLLRLRGYKHEYIQTMPKRKQVYIMSSAIAVY